MSARQRPQLTKDEEHRLRQLLRDWDREGRPKTSAYYRLQDQLNPTDFEAIGYPGREETKP